MSASLGIKDYILLLKCGLLKGDRQIGDFRFVSWFYGQQKTYGRNQVIRQTLEERLKAVFPDIAEPFQVIFIDEENDKIVLPADDIRETTIALQSYEYSTAAPIQIFVQLPDPSSPAEGSRPKKEELAIKMNSSNSNAGIEIVDKLSQLESTVQVLGQRIIALLESLNERKSEKDVIWNEIQTSEKATSIKITEQKMTEPEESLLPLMAKSLENSTSGLALSKSSSSSSFSVQSHSGEDDWTKVGAKIVGGTRRRRFKTESSCASNHSDHFKVQNILLSMTTFILLCVVYRCWFYR